MAAVTATARRSMCIVGARQAVSRAAFVNSALLRADPTARWGLHEGEAGSTRAFSPRDLTASLPEPSLLCLRSPRVARRYIGTGHNLPLRRRIVAKSRHGTQASSDGQTSPEDCHVSSHRQVAPAKMTGNCAKCTVWMNISTTRAANMRSSMGNAGSDLLRYDVMPGDTLMSIAQDVLGYAGRWKEIRDVNPYLNEDGSNLIHAFDIRVPM